MNLVINPNLHCRIWMLRINKTTLQTLRIHFSPLQLKTTISNRHSLPTQTLWPSLETKTNFSAHSHCRSRITRCKIKLLTTLLSKLTAQVVNWISKETQTSWRRWRSSAWGSHRTAVPSTSKSQRPPSSTECQRRTDSYLATTTLRFTTSKARNT